MPTHSDRPNEMSAGPAEAVDLGPLPGFMFYALRRAQLAVAQDIQRHFAADDIRPVQFAVLVVLHRNPGLRATRVALALGVKRTNFVPLFDGLVARGLVERRPVPDDRRAAALYLTEEGAGMLGRLERLVAQHEARFAARLGLEGRYQLMGLLHRLTESAFDSG